MSKTSFILRKANAQGLCPVSIRHSYRHLGKDSNWEKGTGVSVAREYIDLKTGRISGQPDAPELNAELQRVRGYLDRALRKLEVEKTAPTKAAVQAGYEMQVRLVEQLDEAAPVFKQKGAMLLEVLRGELAKLKADVLMKEAEIVEAELRQGINNSHLVGKYVRAYAASKQKTAAAATVTTYITVSNLVDLFNPSWDLREVNGETLRAFESWLIAQNKRNLTITDALTKVKTVCYANAKALGLDVAEIKGFKSNVKRKRNPNVVFLSKNELQDLIDLPLSEPHEERVRDRFVLMSMLGVRFSDSAIDPANIINGELLISTEKTDTDITIPISQQAKAILERYDYTIPTTDLANFNTQLKRICSRVDSLNHKIIVKTYRGTNKPAKVGRHKWEMVTSHVARKTFINLALIKGVNPVAIAAIVGHSGTDLIMSTYGSKDAGKEMLVGLLD
jgi:site-specific recombinase XerD